MTARRSWSKRIAPSYEAVQYVLEIKKNASYFTVLETNYKLLPRSDEYVECEAEEQSEVAVGERILHGRWLLTGSHVRRGWSTYLVTVNEGFPSFDESFPVGVLQLGGGIAIIVKHVRDILVDVRDECT